MSKLLSRPEKDFNYHFTNNSMTIRDFVGWNESRGEERRRNNEDFDTAMSVNTKKSKFEPADDSFKKIFSDNTITNNLKSKINMIYGPQHNHEYLSPVTENDGDEIELTTSAYINKDKIHLKQTEWIANSNQNSYGGGGV